MPKQVVQAGLLAKLGARLATAFEKHKVDDTEYGQVELPSGIRGGLAELKSCGFGIYKTGENEGQPFFRASASVLDPVVFTDAKGKITRTQGQFTSIGPEPFCDTPNRQSRKTLEEHVAWTLNELRKLGVDTRTIQLSQLEAVCGMLVNPKKPIYIRFDTFGGPTQEDPNARVNHKWLGPASAEEAEAAIAAAQQAETQDDSTGTMPPPRNGAAPRANGRPTAAAAPAAAPTPAPAAAPAKVPQLPVRKKPGAAPAPAPPPEPEPEDSYRDDGDILSLAERANNGDEDAARELAEQARSLGFSDVQISTAPTWLRLGEAMANGEDPATLEWEGVDGGDELPAWEPQVDEMYLYKPVDPRTRKRAAKAVECVVIAVGDSTVDLKDNNNPKLIYKGVAWDALKGSE